MMEDPCETCVRWYECNGVDDDCPLKKQGRDVNRKSAAETFILAADIKNIL